MNNFIVRLISEVNEVVLMISEKFNQLFIIKEDKSNKKNDLTSVSEIDYPSVPAVKTGIVQAITTANSYTNTELLKYIPKTEKGSANGVAELDNSGKVPSSQLPSYIDDVVDVVGFVSSNPTQSMLVGQIYYNTTNRRLFKAISQTQGIEEDPAQDKIYVKVDDNTTWRWSGTTLVQLNSGLVLGETSTTAYRGDKGKEAYDHSVNMGNALTTVPDWSTELQQQINF